MGEKPFANYPFRFAFSLFPLQALEHELLEWWRWGAQRSAHRRRGFYATVYRQRFWGWVETRNLNHSQRIGMQLHRDGKVDFLCRLGGFVKRFNALPRPTRKSFGKTKFTNSRKKMIARPKGRSVTQGGGRGRREKSRLDMTG